MNNFYIITNQSKDPNREVTEHIRHYLRERGKTCTEEVAQAECVLVLGGDGTLLRAATGLAHVRIPFLGINLGNMGFLAEVEQPGIDQALDLLIADDFIRESRIMLQGIVTPGEDSGEGLKENLALNDVVILGKKSMQLMCFNLYVNGLLLHRYAADGMIVSTPTGSTGYNLSAGGPIVEPKAEAILLTPLCPHSLNSRSIILSADDIVMIEIDQDKYGDRQQAEVIFDGSRRISLTTGDKVTVSKSEKVTSIIKLSTTNFLQLLHRKMND